MREPEDVVALGKVVEVEAGGGELAEVRHCEADRRRVSDCQMEGLSRVVGLQSWPELQPETLSAQRTMPSMEKVRERP